MDLLQSKYDRLCSEYKKLRKIHNHFKESASLELKEAKEKYERLLHEIQPKSQNTDNEGLSVSDCLQTPDLKSPVSEVCQKCGHTKLDRTSSQSVVENVHGVLCSPRKDSLNDPRGALDCLTDVLIEWSNPVLRDKMKESSYSKTMEETQSRIAELESQLCDLSLQFQMERKRRMLSSELAEENSDGKTLPSDAEDYNTEKRLLLEFMRERIESANTFAQRAISRANLFEDELRALVPHLQHMAIELTELREHSVRQAKAQEEFLNRNLHMGEQLNKLTDELQQLRADSTSCCHTGLSASKQTSFMNAGCYYD